MKRSRSRSGEGQVDRPLVSTSVERFFEFHLPLISETSIAGPREQLRCLPTETYLPHRSSGHEFPAPKATNRPRGRLRDDSVVGTRASE